MSLQEVLDLSIPQILILCREAAELERLMPPRMV